MKFWEDRIQCAVHLINRTASNGITPYEKFHGQRPNLTHLKVFGCLCFVSTLKQGKHKFLERAQECVFLGYSANKKGYKVYNIERNIEIISKDVVFHERLFPYQYMKSHNKNKEIKIFFLTEYPKTTENFNTQNMNIRDFDFLQEHTIDSTIKSDTDVESKKEDNTNSAHINIDDAPPQQRRSERNTRPPKYLEDFYCNTTKHWCGLVQYKDI